jgi:CheY-like chemotaxis protein
VTEHSNPTGPRILSLNDDPMIVECHKAILEDAGYECLTATNDQWALAILRKMPIDLLIQDIKRPASSVRGKDGWSFLQLLKGDPALKDIPVLIVSAAPKDSHEYKLYQDKLAGYVQVPVDSAELLEVIGRFLIPQPILFVDEVM